MVLMTKRCHKCETLSKKLNIPLDSPLLPTHEGCLQNHIGSSKSMESLSCVKGLEGIWQGYGVGVHSLVGDDDSSFRANICHSYANKINPKTGQTSRKMIGLNMK